VEENPYGASEKNPMPFGGNSGLGNQQIQFNHVTVNLNRWSRAYPLQPKFVGSDIHADITITLKHP
jgi:hypothetical protein